MKVFFQFFIFLVSVSIFGQGGLKSLGGYQLGKDVSLLGDMAVLSDSVQVFTANGGLYVNNPEGWLLLPDTQNILLSYHVRADKGDILFTTFDINLNKLFVNWQYVNADQIFIDTLLSIDSCLCVLNFFGNAVFVHGQKGVNYFLFQLTPNGFFEVFQSKNFPSAIQILNENALLVSFYDKILIVNKDEDVRVFMEFGHNVNIRGFVLTKKQQLFVATDQGLFQCKNDVLVCEAQDVTGKLFVEGNRLYVLNQEKNQISIFEIQE